MTLVTTHVPQRSTGRSAKNGEGKLSGKTGYAALLLLSYKKLLNQIQKSTMQLPMQAQIQQPEQTLLVQPEGTSALLLLQLINT